MDASRASKERTFDLFAQPFRILGVDPSATSQQIGDAFSIAQHDRSVSAEVVIFARDALLDPSRRLWYELTYPLDCPASEIQVFYGALSIDASTEKLLQFADLLWPLARANFVADMAGRRPADGTLLYALLAAHASIDATEVYAKLQAARTTAEMPPPSRISINRGLDELLDTHAAAAFSRYDTIQDAAGPTLECTKQALADGERRHLEALGGILGSYRKATDPVRMDTAEHIESACAALQQQPNDAPLIEALSNAVLLWTSLWRPLLMWEAHLGRRELDFETPIEQLRALIANMVQNRHYQPAIKMVDLTRDLFSAAPITIDQLTEDTRVTASLSLYAKIKPLQKLIAEREGDPGHLIAALENNGFGPTSTEPAKELWEAFLRAAEASNSMPLADLPWQLTRNFAIRLSNKPEAAAAVAGLITGLIQYGEAVSAAPAILGALRGNLRFMQSFIGTEPPTESTDAVQKPAPSRMRSLVLKFFGTRTLQSNPKSIQLSSKRNRRLGLAGLAGITSVVLGVSAYYFGFDQVGSFWSKTSFGAQAPTTLGAETMPPVGTGQHLALEGVRYCHFQEERLRIVKNEVRGPEDARAYNLLIIDYNSRCSDFFYKDDDLERVLAEVNEKKPLLEADAKRIMSTWPGHLAEAQKN
jgi:hypothetical protein